MAQTAVDWLLEKIQLDHSKATGKLYENIQKAKEMDKEQKIEAHIAGQCIERTFGTYYAAEQYYNETYGNEVKGERDVDGGYNE